MPLPEKYLRQQIEGRRLAEREASRETTLALLRACAEIILWTLAGLGCIGLALHTFDIKLGRIYWWAGCIIWVGGVSAAILSAYRRGQERGDW